MNSYKTCLIVNRKIPVNAMVVLGEVKLALISTSGGLSMTCPLTWDVVATISNCIAHAISSHQKPNWNMQEN